MSGSNKQTQKKGGWGSLLSGAVANLESRLDTILAEEPEASARQREAEKVVNEGKGRPRGGSGNLGVPSARASAAGSRDASRSRVNDRLAERLAKATAAKTGSQATSGVPSRVGSPAIAVESARASGESSRSTDIARSVQDEEKPTTSVVEESATDAKHVASEVGGDDVPDERGTLLSSGLPINPARISESSSRPSLEVQHESTSNTPPPDLANDSANPPINSSEMEVEMERMREENAQAEKQRQDEMHAYLEKIDALQAKLQYLAKETLAAAREANASSSAGSEGAKLAEKDERIALLMEEGEKLSKTELRHMQTIKKLRSKTTEEEKVTAEVRKKLERAERAQSDLKQKLRRAEVAERQANEKSKQIANIEKRVEELRVDRENASELIQTLTTQLKEAKQRADQAEKEAAEVDRNRIAGLENDLEDAQIEKKLAEDRAAAETKALRQELQRHKERSNAREEEFKNEIAASEAKVEAMRARAEEATTSSEGAAGGSESSVKLMRQVETLQSQYSVAKENWETIEGSLNARLSALENERDEVSRREVEVRKKARDAGVKARKAQEELEAASEQARELSLELRGRQDEIASLQKRLEQAEASLADANADMDRQKKVWEVELAQLLEEEKMRWQRNVASAVSAHPPSALHSSASPSASTRKSSLADLHSNNYRRPTNNRLTSHDLSSLYIDTYQQRPVSSRRSSAHPHNTTNRNPSHAFPSTSPSLSRQESTLSLSTSIPTPLTPSIEIDAEADFEGNNSPNQHTPTTLNDLLSTTSTASPGAGPSVQLVERMSAAVRRLESEKAAFKDEVARLSAQRDAARDEVVKLMRGEGGEGKEGEGELASLRKRYEASLEMLGEREEEVQELRMDVVELKRIYRELVEEKVGK